MKKLLENPLVQLTGLIIMLALLAWFLVMSFMPHADASEVDPSLCRHDWPHGFGMGSSSTEGHSPDDFFVTVTSSCEKLDLKALRAEEKTAAALKKWSEELGREGEEVREVYRYKMRIINDGDAREILLAGWDFFRTPYSRMNGAFAFKIPACSEVTMSFLSPGAPKMSEHMHFYLADDKHTKYRNGWAVTSGSGAEIVIPQWQLFYEESIAVERLTKDGTHPLSTEPFACTQ